MPAYCSETLVLLENDPSVLSLMGRVFRSLGYQVLEARAPEDAIRLCQSHVGPIDLVVADVESSHQSDQSLVSQLQQLRPRMGVVYLAASNYLAPPDLADRYALVAKPFTLDSLSNKVRETLDAGGSKTADGRSLTCNVESP